MSCLSNGSMDIGDLARVTVAIKNASGAYTDPTTLAITVKQPNGAELQADLLTGLVKTASGRYYFEFQITQAGVHYYRWVSTGAATGATEGEFEVNTSEFV